MANRNTHIRLLSGYFFGFLALALLTLPAPSAGAMPATHWVSSWTASPQAVWGKNFPFPTHIPDRLENQTVRQVARISLGGKRLQIVFSNAYGQTPLTLGKASVALAGDKGAIDTHSLRLLTFGGNTTVTIPPGAPLISDPVDLAVPSMASLAVSVYLPGQTPIKTFHWDARQTAWIAAGDQSLSANITTNQSITSRALLSAILVDTPRIGGTVVVIGDSVTDGNGASMDANARWPDFLAQRLAPRGVAVINAGISGARLLSDGMGVNALARFDRDVLDQAGVRSVIVLLGINDISWPGTLYDPRGSLPSTDALIGGYRQLISRAHAGGIRIIGATLPPFEGALPGTPLDNYYRADKDALRRRINNWIRESLAFDAVIDFDALLRDPAHPSRLNPAFDSGDHLHPGNTGNRAMADAIDPRLLSPTRHH
ncbi:SGNH/GDSL hydrolase family protein [Sodalis sp. dw_96]|uniref:SGNH/GDSL hydrolase family protein n=1 Tax=Sodalis sp. dw_96 TaxID=2719794 RepID=UPI001BD36D3E|nr:SGNH/GDSL hydrolase family protein [Sodalis sp. dw_96]